MEASIDKNKEDNHRVFVVHRDGSPTTEHEHISEQEASELYEKYLTEPNSEIVTWDKYVYNEHGRIQSNPTIKMQAGLQNDKLHDVYFKVWTLTPDQIKERVEALGIPFDIWGADKVHFENVTQTQLQQLRKINEENESIFHVHDAGYHEKTGMIQKPVEPEPIAPTSEEVAKQASAAITEMEELIELLQDVLKENPKDQDTQEQLELLQETVAKLKEGTVLEQGGTVDKTDLVTSLEKAFENNPNIIIDLHSLIDDYTDEEFNTETEVEINHFFTHVVKEYELAKESGENQELVKFIDGIAGTDCGCKHEQGGEVTTRQERIAAINAKSFYRYYPEGSPPFELDNNEPYGKGIYFMDNTYYYKHKYQNARLIQIKPNIKSPMIFEKTEGVTNQNYLEALHIAVSEDSVPGRDEFIGKMIDSGYDSLVVKAEEGTYLILFWDVPEFYKIESDIDVMAYGGAVE